MEASYTAQSPEPEEHERFEEPEEGFESATEDVLDVRHAEGAHSLVATCAVSALQDRLAPLTWQRLEV